MTKKTPYKRWCFFIINKRRENKKIKITKREPFLMFYRRKVNVKSWKKYFGINW